MFCNYQGSRSDALMAAVKTDYSFTLTYPGDSGHLNDREVFSAANLAYVMKNRILSIPHKRKVSAIHSSSNKAFSHMSLLMKSIARHPINLLE